MSSDIEKRLTKHGIRLPEPVAAVANYVPYVVDGKHLIISGQLPFDAEGHLAFRGTLGANISLDEGQQAARLCAANILAQARAALGSLAHVERVLRIGGFVAATPDFVDHPKVINGASDLLVDILGDEGRHARFAVGVASLPMGVPVEVDALIAIA